MTISLLRGMALVVGLCSTSAVAQATPNSAGGQQGATPQKDSTKDTVKPDVTFKHPEGKAKIFDLDLNHGQKFVVRIENTCPAAFDYSYEGVERGTFQEQSEKKEPLSNKDFSLVYDQQFGGYVFHVVQKQGADPGKLCEGGEKLVPVSFIVSVRQQNWNLSFSGAFTVSGLTDPVFSIKTENGVKKVIEEPDKENTRRLSVASFVHLFHDHVQWKQLQPALGFGLGINSDNRTEYMIGGGLRFGDRATVNVGRVWGSIDRLPNGVTFDTPITDDNVLNNKGTRIVSRWFFAISYSFIDTRDRLVKPFAPDTGQAATTKAAAPGAKPGGEPDKASIAAIQESAKASSTYKGIAEIASVLTPAGNPAREVCEATTAGAADKLTVTVKVKGVSADQVSQMNTKSAAALTAVASAAKDALTNAGKSLAVTIAELKFEACS